MTPAINWLRAQALEFEVVSFEHQPGPASYGAEAATKLGVPPSQVLKTLVVGTTGGYACALVPVTHQLSLKKLATALGQKSVELSAKPALPAATGYIAGAVSPFGQKRSWPLVMSHLAQDESTLYVSAGKRGVELKVSLLTLLRCPHSRVAVITD